MNDHERIALLTEYRRALHRIPELGLAEKKTSAYLLEKLRETRPDRQEVLCGTGIKCVYSSGRAGAKTLAFRTDMDALAITERSACAVQSQNGNMHACGHDGHMAVLLTFAGIVGRKKQEGNLKHNIVLLFQPAEETASGAEMMIKAGALKNPEVDAVIGMHVMPSVEKGTIALSPGSVMAGNSFLRIRFHGKASHGAQPHLGKDAAAAMAASFVQLQGYMTHAVPARESAVLTFGKLTAGTQRNIVAEEAVMEGLLRAYNTELHKELLRGIQAVCESAASVYGVTVDFAAECSCGAVVNDKALYERYAPCVPSRVEQEPILIAEDFAHYGEQVPTLFAFVGTGEEGRRAPLHSDVFDLSEEALLPAVQYYTNIIEQDD